MQFNIQGVDPSPSFDLLKPGYYPLLIDKAEPQEAKKQGTGTMAKIEYVVYEEGNPANGRRLWEYLTINHDDPKVRSIALGKLARICHAIGNPNASDLSDIVGGVLLGKVGIEPGKDGFEDRNVIKDHKPMPATAQASKLAPAPAAPAAPASPRKAWGKPS